MDAIKALLGTLLGMAGSSVILGGISAVVVTVIFDVPFEEAFKTAFWGWFAAECLLMGLAKLILH